MKNEDYYAELWKVFSGRVVNAYERIITQPFLSDATNQVDANRDRFWQYLIKSLSDDQDDVRGVMLEHLKFQMIEQGQIPTESFGALWVFFLSCKLLVVLPQFQMLLKNSPFILSSFQSHGGRSSRCSQGT